MARSSNASKLKIRLNGAAVMDQILAYDREDLAALWTLFILRKSIKYDA